MSEAMSRYLAGLSGLHEKIESDMPALSHIECMTCGRGDAHNFAEHLAHGWPKCHGATMRLFTVREERERAVSS